MKRNTSELMEGIEIPEFPTGSAVRQNSARQTKRVLGGASACVVAKKERSIQGVLVRWRKDPRFRFLPQSHPLPLTLQPTH